MQAQTEHKVIAVLSRPSPLTISSTTVLVNRGMPSKSIDK